MKNVYTTSVILFIIIGLLIFTEDNSDKLQVQNVQGVILDNSDKTITILNNNSKIKLENVIINEKIGTEVSINCTGKIKENDDVQYCNSFDYKVITNNKIPESYLDNGIFSNYYIDAYNKLMEMSLDEKIAQTLIVHYPQNALDIQKKYQFGGYIFFAKDFKDKTKEEVIKMINNVQNVSKIPLLTAIDEEGGKVSRISDNKNLISSPFKSTQELYAMGGFDEIKKDTINKSAILKELGLNLNLAPVVDVSTNSNDYIYGRTLGQNTALTSVFAKTVIEASIGRGVSYTLKHFPGYGSNLDTHLESSKDYKTIEEIMSIDIPPFISGIEAGAEAIMNSHNIVLSIDPENPSSLSKNINDILRNKLNFTGVIITDDLAMNALNDIENVEIKALNAGNNLLITSNYEKSFNTIKKGINDGTISENELNKIVFRIIAWKYYKDLL